MSEQENTNSGLVLVSSPMDKKILGITNVTRQRDIPVCPNLVITHQRINLYI